MKKFLLVMLVTLASMTYTMASTYNKFIPNEVKIIEHIYDNDEFNTIKIGIPSIISIHENETFEINVRTDEEYLDNKIKYDIKDSTLVIWAENINYDEVQNLNEKNIRIKIMTPNTKLKINALNNDLQIISKKTKNNEFANNEKN